MATVLSGVVAELGLGVASCGFGSSHASSASEWQSGGAAHRPGTKRKQNLALRLRTSRSLLSKPKCTLTSATNPLNSWNSKPAMPSIPDPKLCNGNGPVAQWEGLSAQCSIRFKFQMMSRRSLLSSILVSSTTLALPMLGVEKPALAAASYREYIDRLDGYIFSYPSSWIQVRGAGADVFFRDPVNLDENVVVDFSSPSSSRYKSVEDLGTPEQAAQKVLKQKITEFMSTRLGVRRESKVVSANSRVGDDGRLYYDVEVDVKSYANTNELAVMPQDRVAKLEWSRRYLSTLGVENNRLYELRLQVPEKVLAQEGKDLRQIMNSFQLVKLDV